MRSVLSYSTLPSHLFLIGLFIMIPDSHDWMTPRGSISSVMSTGLQNFVYNAEVESDEENDDSEASIMNSRHF